MRHDLLRSQRGNRVRLGRLRSWINSKEQLRMAQCAEKAHKHADQSSDNAEIELTITKTAKNAELITLPQ